ncbi:Uncharacterised protein [Mycobacteroides abscessus subsp. abscessus]|nr:Uncharacterised protein [Mycobacteroides abscessus subsp. abscessus]
MCVDIALFFEPLHGRPECLHITVTDYHPGPAPQESGGGGVADTARGTGDGDVFARDFVHDHGLYTCQVCVTGNSSEWVRHA